MWFRLKPPIISTRTYKIVRKKRDPLAIFNSYFQIFKQIQIASNRFLSQTLLQKMYLKQTITNIIDNLWDTNTMHYNTPRHPAIAWHGSPVCLLTGYVTGQGQMLPVIVLYLSDISTFCIPYQMPYTPPYGVPTNNHQGKITPVRPSQVFRVILPFIGF